MGDVHLLSNLLVDLTELMFDNGPDGKSACGNQAPTGQPIVNSADDDLADALRDLAHWLYRALEREYEFQTSDETVDEGMSANG